MPRFAKTPGFKDRPVLFIDLEMTGLDVAHHEIIEIAALITRPPKFDIINSFYAKVLPTHIETADSQALEITGYNPKLWQDAIPLRQALEELSTFAPDCILAGWSVQNEWNFLVHALEAERLPYFFDDKMLEVWSLAYAKFYKSSELERLNLANTARHLGISVDRHKPDSDIRATYEIFKKLI
ncbi:MAG: Exonuclease RNase T and DNA polymerase III [Candidatus Amesbacteria bacterium GW2011_GWA2_47_11b]|uniref:Exonuclease RNase T and DNA polymerase III n=3 Tax=Candidatus Amesiibacteriota TaxID=1752730 RepID=A0A0G1US96_9BACT|nr:MAG: Exonuclease RNase T and DNA polymerase III [Microgenomates group bacterium GW2011_GWC1_46_20]KKU58266.1 MAG: Exonuclease RNase T and DNA polymerase III [Candidatus Amesbacteria bacterium GW2011_GWA2_47_11b]KKU68903.1 MAG: Exonuclease RNase T and DNA polymerase III [Candidatus Amesbacteria bacterium GW2011_GWA1_47_20]KKU84780.1 MAG: Exonuclease RNase T and DNA polymerase III [Candidatus Amesbacteria bacterium GW2011_GWC2_47_8]